MSAKPKPQSTEIDHFRDTLTGVVNVVGETRAEMHQRFDQQDKRFNQQDKRFDQQDKRFDQQDKRFDQQDKRFDQQDKEFREFRQETRDRFDQQDKRIAGLEAGNAEIKEMLKVLLSR